VKRRSTQKALLALAQAHGALPVEETPKPGNKYKVSPVEERTWNDRVYASKLEMNFHKELMNHFREDQVHLQVAFELQPGFRMSFDKDLRRPIRYISDFVIGEKPDGLTIRPGSVVIDSKGMRTSEFNILKKLFEYATGNPLWLLKSVKKLKEQIPTLLAMQTINQDMIKTLTDGPFIVVGYASSDGTVAHKKMRIIGREGYLKLVQESLDQLPDAYQALVAETLSNPANKFTDEMMSSAGKALETSLKKKLEDKEQTPEGSGQITPAIGYCDNKLDHFIVLRLEQMDETITHAPEAKVKKASMTGFKDLLEAQLPIHRYVHRINLYPGKYVDVQPA
jgi:hypothetical protein